MESGTSLDLIQNCKRFLRFLQKRWGFVHVSAWIKRSATRHTLNAAGATQVCSFPPSRPPEAGIAPDSIILKRLSDAPWFSLSRGDDDFEAVADPFRYPPGVIAVFALGRIGVLKVYQAGRDQPFNETELSRLKTLLERFTHSLAVCIAYEQVRHSERRYRSMFEDSKVAVFMSTPAGRFLEVNRFGTEMLGYDRTDLLKLHLGRDIFDAFGDWERYKRDMEERGEVRDYPHTLRHKDGHRVFVEETSSTVRNELGETVAFRGILRDVTQTRQLQEQLAHAQRMESIGELAGGIAHDFNNLLTGILGYTTLLQDQEPTEEATRWLGTIEQSARRAQELTGQLLGFARRGRYELRVTQLETVVAETLQLLERVLDPAITIEATHKPGLPQVQIDRGQMQQVVMNLCINARDAMPDGGRLTLITGVAETADFISPEGTEHRVGPFVTLSIQDSGVGMGDDTRRRIFEPFFTTKPLGQGTGLGLSLVYGVVENHGGTITVDSAPGRGTCFMIYLPATAGDVEHSVITPLIAIEPTTEATILVVDDNAVIRELTREVLESEGHTVVLAENGREAVDYFALHGDSIDLVLMDIIMPEMDGRSAYQAIRKMRANVPVIASSGFTQDSWASGMSQEGITFLRKPFTVPELLSVVNEHLRRPDGGDNT